jgi:protein-tyrosine phosphatase
VIDLHCHILPGIDDGAGDLEDAIAMAIQADADGITSICATPHIRHDHDVRIPELAGRVADLNQELARRGTRVRTLVGGEVAETAVAGLERSELAEVGLAGGHWILLEPGPGPLGESLQAAARALSGQGYRAIVAHPERHLGPGAVDVLTALVREGALVQGTAALMEAEESPLHELAARGLIHVLGSDSHSARVGRPVRLSGGLASMRRIPVVGAHSSWVSDEAPAAIVADREIVPPFRPV